MHTAANTKSILSKITSKTDEDLGQKPPSASEKFDNNNTFQIDRLSIDTKGEKRQSSILSQIENLRNARKNGLKINTDEAEHSHDANPSNENNNTLREELNETKSKLRTITGKIGVLKKEKETLNKENKTLQEEVMSLQASLRQMIPGFSNTGSSFPMFNELVSNVSEFYKYDCEEVFFDLLCPELNMKGIIFFYMTSFHRISELIQNYFAPAENSLKKTACMTNLDGPIMNVLRKSFQSTWKNIAKQCIQQSKIMEITNEIQDHLKLGEVSQETNEKICEFLQKLGELVLCFYISDPPLVSNFKAIGSKVIYNPTKHEPLDGFIKNKDECIVVLPSTHKNTMEGELASKALVLQVDYEIPN